MEDGVELAVSAVMCAGGDVEIVTKNPEFEKPGNIDAAHRYGKWVGLCGELGGDAAAVPLLLGMGLDEFSMAPSSIPVVKQSIRLWSMDQCKTIAETALAMPGSTEVLNYLKGLIPS
ncbi:MAG: putative PEP-binding protein [Leptolinea sp.]